MKNKSLFDYQIVLAIISIIMGFIVGAIFLLAVHINPLVAYNKIIQGIFSRPKYMAYAVVYATPLIFTGLAVGFSFKTGVFNIGAEGQFIVGSLAACLVGIFCDLPPIILPIACCIAAGLAGAIWAMIVGYLKVKFGINEVLSFIMFNWIAFYLSNFVVMLPAVKMSGYGTSSKDVLPQARILVSKALRKELSPVTNYGIIFAIVAVIIIFLIIEKTTLGYQLKAVGLNIDAAMFGGINVNKGIMTAMAISGALGGLGGAMQLLGMGGRVSLFAASEGFGFQGISVALIAGSNPLGIFLSGLFYGALKYGGSKLNIINAPSEIIEIIMGTVIMFIAIAAVFKKIHNFTRKKEAI